jgi:hypothetical protein
VRLSGHSPGTKVPSEQLRHSMSAGRKPRAFVLISFEEQYESVYSDLIKAPLENVGFDVERADSRLDQQSILKDIFLGIANADLIVADLTGLNPNVFYELGVAHALAIPTILLTQNVEELPFDLRAYRANEYSTHFSEAPKLISILEGIGEGTIRGSVAFSSPATDFLPSDFQRRPPTAPTAPVDEARRDETSPEEDEVAWLDALNESESRTTEFTDAMARITKATEAVGNRVERHAQSMEQVSAGPESQQVKQASNLAIRVADDLNKYAASLEAEVPVFEENSALLLDPMGQYLAWLQAHPEIDSAEEVQVLQESARGLLEAVRESLPNLREFRETVQGLRGFSRAINSASVRVTKALDRFISSTETIEAESVRILAASESVQAERT